MILILKYKIMKYKWFTGIDISKKTLDVTLYDMICLKKSPYKKVNNDTKGFREIVKWLEKRGVSLSLVLVCMEHTGVYGINLAVFMGKNKIAYSMVSPLHIKRSLGLTRGKNDKIDSYQISRFCYLHREELKLSKLPSIVIQKLRGLINERERLVKMQTIEKQILRELKETSVSSTIKRVKARIKLFASDIILIEKEIEQIVKSEPEIYNNYTLIRSVTGIGLVNAILFIVYSVNFQGGLPMLENMLAIVVLLHLKTVLEQV